jgi:hypothetical protein
MPGIEDLDRGVFQMLINRGDMPPAKGKDDFHTLPKQGFYGELSAALFFHIILLRSKKG